MSAKDTPVKAVRTIMRRIAKGLNAASGGKLSPNTVTLVGIAAHIPIAWLIATGELIPAAILLVIFGLFDTLDGELARLQGKSSVAGMLLDASTDRMKEVMLYAGAGYYLAASTYPKHATWAIVACGASICVSYVKAKGEAAFASTKNIEHSKLNRAFSDGLLTFELRMLLLVIGLAANVLVYAVGIIAVLATYTAIQRLLKITRQLT